MTRLLFSAALAGILTMPGAVALAQTDTSRVMGVVTDGSGGALPGVTVTVSGVRTISVVTDETGRYMTAWIAPGTYTVSFALSGFDSRTVRNVPLQAGHTVVVDQQLSLAPVTETVEVTAAAPPPPPPPTPPTEIPVPRPKVTPVEKEILASVCVPRLATTFTLAMGKIVSHQDANRQLLGPGDSVKVDVGENHGVTAGQNLVIRRRFAVGDHDIPKKQRQYGEQGVGMVQIIEVFKDASLGVIVHACGEIVAGDTLEPYLPQPAFFAVADGKPRYDEPGKITLGEHGQNAGSEGQMMVIDRGVMQGVQRGQRVTIFRTSGDGMPPLSIGDAVIVSVRADSATILIGRTTDAIAVGDLVAPHR
jgi:Carboxypeptidase regulatory-like domain